MTMPDQPSSASGTAPTASGGASAAKIAGTPSSGHSRPSWLQRLSKALGSGLEPSANGKTTHPSVEFETTGDFACPGCGAVLHDLTAETCPYCGAAFSQVTADLQKHVWHLADDGTWSRVEQPLPQMMKMDEQDEAFAAVLRIRFPKTPSGPHKAIRRTIQIGRSPKFDKWFVPPTVPNPIAEVLQPLPDECPSCHSTTFDVVLGDAGSWTVVCKECRGAPGARASAN
jgi:Zn finger protein HypA/HybF involved in hydrogenase expression